MAYERMELEQGKKRGDFVDSGIDRVVFVVLSYLRTIWVQMKESKSGYGKGESKMKYDTWKRGIFRGIALLLALCLCLLCGCSGSTAGGKGDAVVFHDSCGRDVKVPAKVERVAPSGSVAQMILGTLAPEMLCGLANTPGSEQMRYFPSNFQELPIFGQFYGSKANLDLEALLSAKANLIVDLGDMKSGHAESMDQVQAQCGIPTVFLDTTLEKISQAYRDLGKLLGKEAEAEERALFIEKTLKMAAENAAKIPAEERLSVMYGSGSAGLNCNAQGSIQADVLEFVGGVNAIVVPEKELSNKGGGNTINMEQLYLFDPDIILLTDDGPYETVGTDEVWSNLRAVQNGSYYEIPCQPYNWLSNPPSVNRVLGIWWLGNLLYPQVFDYDMVEIAQEFYRLFYAYELSTAEAEEMLRNSTLKRAEQLG